MNLRNEHVYGIGSCYFSSSPLQEILGVERRIIQQNSNFITTNVALKGGGEVQSYFYMGRLFEDSFIRYSNMKNLHTHTQLPQKNLHSAALN